MYADDTVNLEEYKLTNRYELHVIRKGNVNQLKIVQVHPIHGQRSLIDADGHGQLVWVGEVAGSLLILDQWSVMGYKDGSLRVLDPETLESRAYITLDFDDVGILGFDDHRFVLSQTGKTPWRAWSLVDWEPLEEVAPVKRADFYDLKEKLTIMLDLPRS